MYQQLAQSKKAVYVKGSGSSGCLLTGKLEDEPNFVRIKGLDNLLQLSLGGLFALGIFKVDTLQTGEKRNNEESREPKKNNLKVWGFQKGIIVEVPLILQIKFPSEVNLISCGWNHALVSLQNGTLLGYGQNKYGQLGFHNKSDFYSQLTPLLQNQKQNLGIKAFAAGFRQSYWVTKERLFYGCGQSKNFEIAQKLKKGVALPHNIPFEENKEEKPQIIKISCGKKFVLGLAKDGNVYGVGLNQYNCLSSNQESYFDSLRLVNSNIKDISCGWTHALFLDNLGRVWTRGRNNFGQQGTKQSQKQNLITLDEQCSMIQSGTEFNFCLTKSGKLFGWGWNEHLNIIQQNRSIVYHPTHIEIPQDVQIQKCITHSAITILIGNKRSII